MPACIQIAQVTKTFGATVAVSDLSLEVETGEVLGLLGPNGAGKSTTLCMLSGLVRPTSGTIALFGKDPLVQFLDIAPRMGVLMERPAFYNHLSVRKNLSLLAALSGREVTIDRTLDLVGLLRVASQKVGKLSRGMRQRVGLAQALIGDPELLLLDEPTSGLDVESTQEMLHLLRRLADEAHVTIVFSSHMMHEVESLCDRVAILNGGRLVACEATDDLMSYDSSAVDVVVEAPEGAARRLADQAWVESATLRSGRIEVRLRDGTVPQLTAFLVASGYKVSGVIPKRRTLQEYFLKVLNV
ncbi:MAG TPA: ABC transporter ATP-binding protein [Candidatus Hydrogenedentes bacterium]|nr:ABC transporter ATP-binding protein [Candidatus Hydrogenedentota bacterium]HPG66684.1 ABC transporter ATP-binding protein [Candidatus Hydrogenedentota bacterium]